MSDSGRREESDESDAVRRDEVGARAGTGGTDAVTVDPERDPRDEPTQIATEERRRSTPFVSAIVAAIGAWVVASAFFFEAEAASLWNGVVVGAVVFLAAGYNFYRVSNDIPPSTGVGSLVAVLGLWLIASAALLGMPGGLFWSTVVSGLLIAGLAGYDAYESREARTVAGEGARVR